MYCCLGKGTTHLVTFIQWWGSVCIGLEEGISKQSWTKVLMAGYTISYWSDGLADTDAGHKINVTSVKRRLGKMGSSTRGSQKSNGSHFLSWHLYIGHMKILLNFITVLLEGILLFHCSLDLCWQSSSTYKQKHAFLPGRCFTPSSLGIGPAHVCAA